MRILHTMLRVKDLEASRKFYTEVLDMQVLRRVDEEKGQFSLLFLGYRGEREDVVLELTHNWDGRSYEMGSAYGHIAIGVENIEEAYKRIIELGGKGVRGPKPRVGGKTPIAFIEDPDGYKIELIERDPSEWHL